MPKSETSTKKCLIHGTLKRVYTVKRVRYSIKKKKMIMRTYKEHICQICRKQQAIDRERNKKIV